MAVPDPRAPLAPPAGGLPRLGEELSFVLKAFDRHGLLGTLAVDTSPLAAIERRHGAVAHDRVRRRIEAAVHAALRGALGPGDRVLAGGVGRHEVLVLLFRTPAPGDFFTHELPALAAAVRRRLALVAAPGERPPLRLGVGYSATLRNPRLGAETQLRHGIDEARSDAELELRIDARERRRELLGTVLSGSVFSVYEPIVDVATRTVFGYEALARGPSGSTLHEPSLLFGAAERESLIFELDCLCRRSGLEGAAELPSGTHLFLNVRPTTIHDPAFRPDALVRSLERTGLAPESLVFEISEQESIASFARFREIRDDYRAAGFRFALDDTGAGYASLQAVIELEPEFIKVDRALISGLDASAPRRTLLRALHAVAGAIDARIIAEGLDTLEELEALGELGIPFGQGWLFGKPTPLLATP